MKENSNAGTLFRWVLASGAALALAGVLWGLVGGGTIVRGQTTMPLLADRADASAVYSPANRTLGQAVRDFFGWRPRPVQPIPFPHRTHVDPEGAGLACETCHSGVNRGPVARIPSVEQCMECHIDVATESPHIQLLTAHYERGEELPWQRVYGWPPDAHARFHHAAHIQAGVACITCHGDVSQMIVAERAVNHTMGFCVNCHAQEGASNDCLTCHF